MGQHKFGETLKRYRKENSYTLTFVSEHLGFTPAFLSGIETGTRPPSALSLEKINAFCDLCGIEDKEKIDMCYLMLDECDKVPSDIVTALLEYNENAEKKPRQRQKEMER